MSLEQLEPELWQRLDRIFEGALEVPTAGRSSYLDRACAGDSTLRRQVELLIAADHEARRFLETPLAETLPDLDQSRRRVGPYRLLRTIGFGGMGTVYLAARDDDEYRRLVAVKLLRGDGGDGMSDRFRRERQILADLEHPHIARLYDGGTTADGRPYLVMEFVDGLPIDAYCRCHGLSIRQRLELFCQVCAAVTHAHRSLLVHRDLKPSNILVTEEGRPVLLDFGIAKPLGPRADDGRASTRAGLRLMTPEYASPEQVRGDAITTASDVYSLGVVLYELLTGSSPYRTAEDLPHEIERAVCEQEPIALSAVHGLGKRSPLRGDLDAIVLQALGKEPGDRYGSVEQMAADVRRHLDDQPVTARRLSSRYRAYKFVRRHYLAVAVAAAILALGLVFSITVTMQARRLELQREVAETKRAEAERERDKTQRALDFLVDVFEVAEPESAQGETITARQILEAAARSVRHELREQADVRAMLLGVIGEAYMSLGLYDQASPLLTEAFELRRRVLGPTHPDVASSLSSLAHLRTAEGGYEEADDLYRQALDLQKNLLGDDDPRLVETLHGRVRVALRLSRYDEAEARAREALRILRLEKAGNDREMALGLAALAQVLARRGELEEAVRLYREALTLQRRFLPERHPDVVAGLANLGITLNLLGEHEEAEALTREALELARRVLGVDHPETSTILHNLAHILDEKGDLDASVTAYREALTLRRSRLGDRHPVVAVTLNNLAVVLEAKGELDDALALHRQALAIRRDAFGRRHHAVANSLCSLGNVERRMGQLDDAEHHYQLCLDIVRELQGDRHPTVSHALVGLGRVLLEKGEPAEALSAVERSLAIRQNTFPAGHWRIAESQRTLGGCLTALGRFAEAESLLLETHRQVAGRFRPDHPGVAESRRRLVELYEAWGKPERARELGDPSADASSAR